MRFALLFLLLTACIREPGHIQVVLIEEPFRPYFDDFEQDAEWSGHPHKIDDLIINFGNPENDNFVGECFFGTSSTTPTIIISPFWWATLTDDQKQELIYHEMGHCVLNRGHKITYWNNEYDSIMWPNLFPPGLFTRYHDHYVTELFTGAP